MFFIVPLIQGFLSGIDALLPSIPKQNLSPYYPSPFSVSKVSSRVQQIISKPQAVVSSKSKQKPSLYYPSPLVSRVSLSDDDESTIPSITQKFQTITSNPNICIVIDVENVRGKTSFELDHADLLDRLLVWTTLRGYALGRTIVVVDHGSKSSAHLLKCHDTGSCNDGISSDEAVCVCVSFAGPGNIKADDVIARDVRWLLSTKEVEHVTVITADQELAWRCRSAAPRQTNENVSSGYNSILKRLATKDNSFGPNPKRGGRKKKGNKKSRSARKRQYMQAIEEPNEDVDELDEQTSNSTYANTTATTNEEEQSLPTVEIIAPQRFLEDLEYAMHEWLDQQEKDIETDNISINNIPIPKPVGTLQDLFKLRGQILTIESTLRKKCTLHKRQTLTGELRLRKKEWRDILSTLTTNNDGNVQSSLAWSLSSTISSLNDEDDDDNTLLSSSSSLPSVPVTNWDELSQKEQDKLLLRWGKHRGRHGTKREKTEDRIVLAERLRRQLELLIPNEPPATAPPSLASEYAEYINNQL